MAYPPPLAFGPSLEHRVDERALTTGLYICLPNVLGRGYREVQPTGSPRTLQLETCLGERRGGGSLPSPTLNALGWPIVAPGLAVEEMIRGSLENPECRNV